MIWQHQAATRIETLAPVAGPVIPIVTAGSLVSGACSGKKCGAVAESRRTVLLRAKQGEQFLRAWRTGFKARLVPSRKALAVLGGVHRATVGTVGTHHPFGDAHHAQMLRLVAAVNEPDAHLLDGCQRVHAP